MSDSGLLKTLKVKLIGETKDFQNDMTESAKKVKAVGDDLTAAGNKMSLGVTAPLIAAGTAALALASDLDESRNKATVVFDEMSSSVLDFASTSATALGMAEEQALGMTSTYGSLLKNMGMLPAETAEWSKRLTELTADYASFHNLQPEEAFEKIKAGLVGSSEPLLSLGKDLRVAAVEAYAMDAGLMQAGDTMDNLTLTQARLGAMFSQSQDELGDFARTSDGLANSTRIVKAEVIDLAAGFGQDLIPMAQDVLEVVIPMLETFNNLPEGTRKFIITMAGAAAAAGPLISVSGKIISSATMMQTALATAGTSGVGALTSMVNPATAVAGALVAVAGAGYKIHETNELVKEGSAGVSQAMQDLLGEASSGVEIYNSWAAGIERANKEYENTQSIAKVFVNMNKITEQSLVDLSNSLIAAGVSHEEYTEYMYDAFVQADVLGNKQALLIQYEDMQKGVLSELAVEYGYVTESMYNYRLVAEEMPSVYEEGEMWLNRMGLAAEDTAQSDEVLAQAEKEAADEAERLAQIQADAQAAADATAQSYLSMASALKDATNTEVARTEIGLLDEMFENGDIDRQTYSTAVSDIGLAYGLMDEKSAALAANLPIMNQLLEDGMLSSENMSEAMGLLYDEASDGVVDWESLLEELGTTPETSDIVVEAMNAIRSENAELIATSDNLLSSWKSLQEWAQDNIITLRINEYVTSSTSSSGSGGGWNGGTDWEDYQRADGGPVLAGQPYVVNEMGRGEMFVSDQNGYVLNRGDAMQAGDPVSNAEVVRAINALGDSLAVKIADQLAVRG